MQPLQTLLVVDDDLDIRDALQDAFELEGYSVLLAADGLEALAQLRQEGSRPHLILLDLMMPRMDGFAFREALRHDTALSDIPVVVASADLHLEAAAKQLDVAGCLRKPLDLHELLSTVKRLSQAV
ncbi:response regulator [Myxococcus llanfairpwllgwyngyllgogerychwyrndrobwllllantysiliogogogochensis]|uniref:Response regulator n=1 Tax=Myxococcus llanfairpwllgwyngyllgogerychwyrndrobwllllantysiliogogogochensis TaxID=2590453 RepID=A0A540X1J0_9BACT|nr:response regulator [Myxococcus llanfairpwllgwyngyllgogerychwyrndrobwllllantysiliogogogochensis]NTX02699.1 response regulator [Myxococcus sp. CA040A]NTX11121.1 response regulator [Myxococcus sp. CA056]NTX34788.1 response regulator [Myxococcus sp. CA033]TQF15132.1 response regulator [Myxococcus llanfairpwllgwyngyllgogerychwyrndrobwllllantysiliogogogochensis]